MTPELLERARELLATQFRRYDGLPKAHVLEDLIAALEASEQERERWLEWSNGQYPDDSPGDVISAEPDGTIVLDDGVTTWNPLRALKWFAALSPTTPEEDE